MSKGSSSINNLGSLEVSSVHELPLVPSTPVLITSASLFLCLCILSVRKGKGGCPVWVFGSGGIIVSFQRGVGAERKSLDRVLSPILLC